MGRFERSAAVAVAGMVAILWFAGEQASTVPVAQASGGLRLPVSGGGAFVLLVFGIIALNALFVASETALDLLTNLHVKHAAGEKLTLRLQALLDRQPKYVAAASIGSQAARLGLIFAGLLMAQDLAQLLFVVPEPSFGQILAAAALISIPVGVVNLILGELVPKSFATMHVSGVANRLYGFIRGTSLIFSIPAALVVAVANLVTVRFGGRASFTMADAAEEQIKSLVEEAQESGEIEVDEKELLHSVFEFTDTVVREVMTPRVDLEGMPVTSDPAEIARVIQASGHSRIPLFEETDDQIVGIIHAKDLLLAMVEGKVIDLRELMRPALFVPENMNLHEALTEMRLHRAQMAVVQDEFGGTAGIVTTEDIVEELVGDIIDEYDEEEPALVRTAEGYLVDGKTHVDDINEEIGSHFTSDEFDTIGGFVFGLFGKQPKEGESIASGDYLFTVAETDGRRILKLAITPTVAAAPEE
jgi:putative hemolysin